MSRVQPPGRLPSLGGRPVGAKTPGCGQVRASFGMTASMLNGLFVKWLANVVSVSFGGVAGGVGRAGAGGALFKLLGLGPTGGLVGVQPGLLAGGGPAFGLP